MKTWKRPADVEYPKVWHRFKGRNAMPDGTYPTFRIQDIPPDMFDKAVDYMLAEFITNEPLCKATGIFNEPISVDMMKKRFAEAIEEKVSLVCFRENPNSPDEEIYPEIVGMNVLLIKYKDAVEDFERVGEYYPIVMGAVYHTGKLVNVFEKYNVDIYLGARGLSVAKGYRGQNIGVEILKARAPLCKALGIKVTATSFTNVESQTVARKAGFEELSRISYEELTKLYGKQLESIPTKHSYLMALVTN